MKALTIWQPWASLIAAGEKKYETRSWETKYRGPIAIHSAKILFDTNSYFDRELYPFAYALDLSNIHSFDTLPYGCIVATAELLNCFQVTPALIKKLGLTKKEIYFGDWTPGRYAWELTNVKMFENPIKVNGKQRLWNWEALE